MAAAAITTALAACGGKPAAPQAPAPKGEAATDAGYVAAPDVIGARASNASVILDGVAGPLARVRLATPEGQAVFADADSDGRWRMVLPASASPRIFGLSMTTGGRQVQAQGYVLLTPAGLAVLLRAGTGALVRAPPAAPRILAFDADRQGGAVVSGIASPAAAVSVRVDGRQVAVSRADAGGRLIVPLAQPIHSGQHQIEIVGDTFRNSVTIDATPAPPLAGGPFRTTSTAPGLRVDWMTPAGGLQSTWILN